MCPWERSRRESVWGWKNSGTACRLFGRMSWGSPTRRSDGPRATGREPEPVRTGRPRPGLGPRDGTAPGGRMSGLQYPAPAIPGRRDHAPLRAAAPDVPACTQVQGHDSALRTRRFHHQRESGQARVPGAYPDRAVGPVLVAPLLQDPTGPARDAGTAAPIAPQCVSHVAGTVEGYVPGLGLRA